MNDESDSSVFIMILMTQYMKTNTYAYANKIFRSHTHKGKYSLTQANFLSSQHPVSLRQTANTFTT